jgi:DNA excision repair protein ERCC-2
MPESTTVAVRTLCEFTSKWGDLDLRFTPSPTAQQGIAGHAEVTSRRGSHYQKEVQVTGSYRHMQVRGRADGYDPQRKRLEEIKTHRGSLDKLPENHRQLHWAQAKVYAWLMCQQLELPGMEVALVYFDIASQQETVLAEHHEAASLKLFFEDLCERYLRWAELEDAHRLSRDCALSALTFPHEEFRLGQRVLAEAVYKANATACCLLAQAPTGIGKTMGVLFPTLKAVPGQRLDKVFFLTAKTPGRQLALDALQRLQTNYGTSYCNQSAAGGTALSAAPHLPLRVLEMVAKEKACEYPDKACHGDSCPLAKGFYDRLPIARQAAVESVTLSRQALRTLALQHAVCPYYLSQEMLRWSDVVVGDYNHFLDLNAILNGLTVSENWRVSVLIDEAHNLVSRSRQMYTGELDRGHLKRLRNDAPPALKNALDRVNHAWNALLREQGSPPSKVQTGAGIAGQGPSQATGQDPVSWNGQTTGGASSYAVHEKLPEKLLQALKKMTADMADFFAESPVKPDGLLQDFYFDALFFLRLADLHGTHSLFDVSLTGNKNSVLCLRNVVPGPMLKERWLAAHSVTLFSATLSPAQYLLDMLGLPVGASGVDSAENAGTADTAESSAKSTGAGVARTIVKGTAWVDVPSAFEAQQLQVHVSRHISTRFHDRAHSLDSLVAVMSGQFAQTPGNYLAFFSSFDYLTQAADALTALHPGIPVWQQARRMDESAREDFLARFTPRSQGIGFAVLGGAFGEGIDLPGARLIGAFIATLGMPQINPVNEQIRQRMQACLGRGYDYTYLFPGIQKVVQAAGRVIRTPQDKGVVFLMDDRFAHAEVQALLPVWWQA